MLSSPPRLSRQEIINYITNYFKEHNKSPILNDCHPFKYYHINKYFGTWNNALKEAYLPLNRNQSLLVECKFCQNAFIKQIKEIYKSENDFCSHSCSAKYNNKGRKMSEETKEKIRKKLQIIRCTTCEICSVEIYYRKRKKKTCGDKCLSELKKLIYKRKKIILIE